jgi:hypothetical protein
MNKLLFAITATTLLLAQCHCLDIVCAINLGQFDGWDYTSESGITYTKDDQARFSAIYSVNEIPNLTGPDLELYIKLVYKLFSHRIPLAGDGWYALVIHEIAHTERPPGFNVSFDNMLVLSNYSPNAECPLSHICDKVVYFFVCNNMIFYNGTSTPAVNNSMVVNGGNNAPAHALVLAKGVAGERRTVIKNLTSIYFDPAQERKCVKT